VEKHNKQVPNSVIGSVFFIGFGGWEILGITCLDGLTSKKPGE